MRIMKIAENTGSPEAWKALGYLGRRNCPQFVTPGGGEIPGKPPSYFATGRAYTTVIALECSGRTRLEITAPTTVIAGLDWR